jgi:hypothetical protein
MPTIGINLSQWGNVGEYETDRSTWGFADTAFVGFTRSNSYGFALSKSCRGQLNVLPGLYPFLDWIPQRFTAVAGKKYKAFAYVTKSGGSTTGSVVEIVSTSANMVKQSAITKTFGELNETTTYLETIFTCSTSGNYTLQLRSTNVDSLQTLALATNIFADVFAIFEWEDPAPPACTLAFNLPSCIVTNETTPLANDGSITLAVTGAAGTVEYSKDNGATWQSSALFSGLDSGTYICKVREVATISCVITQSFAVNSGSPTFSWTSNKTDETVSGANDGSIAITVTGTAAPFTFSKDGGVIFQGGNVFTGLAPGTYTITVRNAASQLVSANVTILAGTVLFEKAFFSRDFIPFIIPEGSNASEDNYKLYTDVRVEEVTGSSLYTSKFTTLLEPASDGLARFNLRPAFRNLLKATPPTLNRSTFDRITDRIKFFKCFYGELYNDLVVPSTFTDSNVMVVLLGGLDKKKYPSFDFFTSYLPTSKKFLTWTPMVKQINRAQEEYLSFFVYATGITSLKVQVTSYYDDATNSTYIAATKTGTVKGHLYEIPVGPAHAGILAHNPAKNLTHYEVQLLNQVDVVVSEKRTYILNAITAPYVRYFLYLNSVGGYDTLLCTGKSTTESKIERSVVQKHLPMDYNALDGELEVNESVFQKVSDHSTGFLKGSYGKEYQQSLLDFMNSRRVFEITSGQRVPVLVDKATVRYSEDESNEYYLRFTVQEAYVNHSYTPDGV